MSEIYMMVTICNRKQMQKFVKFYKQNHVDTGNISLAMGTAASDVLDYFGLEEDEKGIHFCLAHLLILYRCKETVPSPYQ